MVGRAIVGIGYFYKTMVTFTQIYSFGDIYILGQVLGFMKTQGVKTLSLTLGNSHSKECIFLRYL